MPKFKVSIFPAQKSATSVCIAITNVIKRTVVECKLDDLPSALEEAAKGVTSPMADMPLIQVSAYPEGRAPNGFKAFEAARKNILLIDPAGIAAPQPETADAF